MEPQIQYATTADAVSIAYYVMGDGAPLVFTSNTYGSHLLLVRSANRQTFEALERRHRVVRYDGRGSGLSQRESPDFSLAARILDLEAVVDRLGTEQFALSGSWNGALTAVAFVVRHPGRVSHLILEQSYACGRDWYAASPAARAIGSMRGIANDQWESYTLAAANFANDFSDSKSARERAAVLRASMEPAAALAWRDATTEIDMTDVLPQIRVPTLVICRPSKQYTQPQSSQVVASRIPGARLIVLAPWAGEGVDEERLRAVAEFLGDAAPADEADDAPASPQLEAASAFRTILFTDIVGHTEMMQRLGDDAGRAVLREHERITREALSQHGGHEVKTDGDSFMASFTSATKAVECAIALQRAFAAHSDGTAIRTDRSSDLSSPPEPIVVRMGLNIGEPIQDEGTHGRTDFFGSTVILGARIRDQAASGEILVPEALRHLLAGKSFVFADRGETPLKGFDDPVRLYEVRWRPMVAAGDEDGA